MAQEISKSEWKSLYPLRYIARLFKEQTISQLEVNMATQHVFPYAVYSAYPEINEYRRQHGGWYSTGEGAKSFEGVIYEADENTGMVTMGFRFNDYMQYVDIGVGAGRKHDDVQRSKNVAFKNRYISKWNPSGGATHRPGIRPEVNHALTRLESYVQRYYDAKIDFQVLETFEGTPLNLNIL